MSPAPKIPNNDSVARMAALIVNKEISRLVGPTGALGLMKIGALVKLIHPLYRAYYDVVDKGEIHLNDVQRHFSPAVWAAMPTAKRRQLAAGIRKEAEQLKAQIHQMMLVLHKNDTQLATLTGKGRAALDLVMAELMGEEAAL